MMPGHLIAGDNMELPIQLIKYSPPHFKWKQVVNTIGGVRVLEHSGRLPPSVEEAVACLVRLAEDQAGQIKELTEQLAKEREKPGVSETTFVKQPLGKRK